MKHEPAADARSDLARRITERAKEASKRVVLEILPMGEPDPDRLARSDQIRAEIDAKRRDVLDSMRGAPAVRRMGNNGKYYTPAPRVSNVMIPGKDVRDLVDEGEMTWINECHSAAKLKGE